MAATSVLIKSYPSLVSRRPVQNFPCNFCFIKSAKFSTITSYKLAAVRDKSFLNIWPLSLINKNSTTVPDASAIITKTSKTLIQTLMLVLLMMMCSRVPVLAISMGEMGGSSFSILWPLITNFRRRSSFKSKENCTNVIKLQVGLCVNGPRLQNELDRISKTVDTSTRDGFARLLRETTTCLLQHSDCWKSVYSRSRFFFRMKSAEKHFNQLLENERILKFNEEALEFKLNDTGLLENETTTMHQVNHQFTDTHVVGIKVLWLPRQENEILSYQELQKQYLSLQAFEN
ncbi:Myelin-associated oligodendrocyte basic protein isoform 1 [Citrus sinensis]|uniref:Myelin-associated oligodendrocyte basic protein isoform 1 n=1 Tax=Citrus sinensis TaxID=2711 RepID=A0ACB8LAM0_CITSI|nr:Myelin-associated oligodendrocyte basic protein isoform 1 [Citrus sinensis]